MRGREGGGEIGDGEGGGGGESGVTSSGSNGCTMGRESMKATSQES
jgi:hypothetical protein